MSEVDVLVVGCRIAGSLTALRLAARGVVVRVLESRDFPSADLWRAALPTVPPMRFIAAGNDILGFGDRRVGCDCAYRSSRGLDGPLIEHGHAPSPTPTAGGTGHLLSA